jgi:transcriptional regulator with XRE-family HTH domain
MATFGAQLKAAREAAGLSRVQLAERLHVGQGQIEKIENDRDEPTAERQQRLLAACRAPRPDIATRVAQIEARIVADLRALAGDLETIAAREPTSTALAEVEATRPRRRQR